MTEILSQGTRKARKDHVCDCDAYFDSGCDEDAPKCSGTIKKGDEYHYHTWYEDGWVTNKLNMDCVNYIWENDCWGCM